MSRAIRIKKKRSSVYMQSAQTQISLWSRTTMIMGLLLYLSTLVLWIPLFPAAWCDMTWSSYQHEPHCQKAYLRKCAPSENLNQSENLLSSYAGSEDSYQCEKTYLRNYEYSEGSYQCERTYLRKYEHSEDSYQCEKTYLRKYEHSEESDQCQKNVPT